MVHGVLITISYFSGDGKKGLWHFRLMFYTFLYGCKLGDFHLILLMKMLARILAVALEKLLMLIVKPYHLINLASY